MVNGLNSPLPLWPVYLSFLCMGTQTESHSLVVTDRDTKPALKLDFASEYLKELQKLQFCSVNQICQYPQTISLYLVLASADIIWIIFTEYS